VDAGGKPVVNAKRVKGVKSHYWDECHNAAARIYRPQKGLQGECQSRWGIEELELYEKNWILIKRRLVAAR
jgi:hypothetical protein